MIEIIKRTLGYPFFFGLSLVGAFILWLKWQINFIKYGAEFMVYSEKGNKKTIADVFNELQKQQNKNIDWDKLKQSYFDECVENNGLICKRISYAPHDLFEWFKSNVNK